MNSKPPQTTILFKGIPPETENWLVGIDTKFLSINQLLKGIKLVPEGIHLLHYSIPTITSTDQVAATESSIRYARWIECKDDVLVLNWNGSIEKFDVLDGNDEVDALNYSKLVSGLGDEYEYMVKYPENHLLWTSLIDKIDIEVVQEFVPFVHQSFTEEFNTITPSKEENMILLDQLQQKDPARTYEDQSSNEFSYTIINLKAKNQHSQSIQQISQDYLDKSWYVEQLYGNDHDLLLGELQLSFILFIVLGNFCSGLQWMNLLKLLSMSKTFIKSHRSFSLQFLKCFTSQLETIPSEYVGETINLTSVVDTKNFVTILENFIKDIYPRDSWEAECCGKMKLNGIIIETWKSTLQVVERKFKLDISQLENQKLDENHFEVYDLQQHDENDEDAPTLV